MVRRPELVMADLDAETATPLPRRETLSCQFACVNVTNVVGVNLEPFNQEPDEVHRTLLRLWRHYRS